VGKFADMPLLSHEDVKLGQFPCRIVRQEFAGEPAATLIIPREYLVNLWRELSAGVRAAGGAPVGMEAFNSLRLELGMPWFGVDYGDKQIPHEAGLEHTHISYEKGCYTGQEIVERVRSRGHVNRRLAELQFSAAVAPPPGTTLTHEGSEAGSVTSTGYSPLLARAIGLGYVRREHSAVGTRMDASGISVEVIAPPLLKQKTPA
jgi:folate-binding protein YgfZ